MQERRLVRPWQLTLLASRTHAPQYIAPAPAARCTMRMACSFTDLA